MTQARHTPTASPREIRLRPKENDVKVKDLKKLLDVLDPEADVVATTDDLAQWHCEVTDAILARRDGAWLILESARRAKKANAVVLFVGPLC
jgi:hypothetical protein